MSDRQEHQTSPVTFRFSNIGPVKEAALKLGELTVIAGRNNTGKTYIAYSLYGFLKQWRGWPSSADVFANTPADFPEIVAIRDGIRSTGRAAVPISLPTLAQQRKILAGMIGRDFSPEFRNVFNSRRDSFRSAGLRIEIDDATAGQLPSPVKVKFGHWGITMHCDGGSIIASLNASDRSVG